MRRYEIRLPASEGALSQDREYCDVRLDRGWRRIRFHEYGEIYSIPGLYEQIFYDILACSSHKRVSWTLGDALRESGDSPSSLRVLELGAGNGVVGEELLGLGIKKIVGVDILPEAHAAARRDRPEVYDDYLVADLTRLRDEDRSRIARHELNCLVTVAALGFSDIPPEVFATAFNLVAPSGWVAFNVKVDFLNDGDPTGFARLVQSMIQTGTIEVDAYRRYCHRRSTSGSRLYYVAIVARKRKHLEIHAPDATRQGDAGLSPFLPASAPRS